MSLYNAFWAARMSRVAAQQQKHHKLIQNHELRLTKDLQVFMQCLKYNIRKIDSATDCNEVAKLCLSYLIAFNKRLPMQVGELHIKDFVTQAMATISDNEEVLSSLDEAEKILSHLSISRCRVDIKSCL